MTAAQSCVYAEHMATFRDVSVTDARAHALLQHYFAHRAATFPPEQGTYVTTLPTPAQFVAPHGAFVIAEDENGESLGCGGVRRIQRDAGTLLVRFEVKHVWVEPASRGTGLGRALLLELERRATEMGAQELVLDTNDSLEAAGGLYRSSGYEHIEPYNANPNATAWYGKVLRDQ